MTPQHDAVAAVLIGECDHTPNHLGKKPCEAEAAIEALREGARERLDHVKRWWFESPDVVIDAILGQR